MAKKQAITKIEIDKKGRYELWELNRKGFYNFVKYLTREEYEKMKGKQKWEHL